MQINERPICIFCFIKNKDINYYNATEVTKYAKYSVNENKKNTCSIYSALNIHKKTFLGIIHSGIQYLYFKF